MTQIQPDEVLPPPGKEIEHSPGPVEQPSLRNREDDETKALAVLRAILAAGVKRPFDMNPDEWKQVWGVKLGRYPIDVLMEAAREWIDNPGVEFPSVAEVETQAQYVQKQRDTAAREAQHAHTVDHCELCAIPIDCDPQTNAVIEWENVHYYRVVVDVTVPVGKDQVSTTVESHVMRPCPRCLPEMSVLWDQGHFDADHKAGGGCKSCRHYHWPWKYKDPRTQKGRIG